MKRLLIFLGVISIACGLLFIPSLLDSTSKADQSSGANDSEIVKQIKADITQLSTQQWNKTTYDNIATAIQAAYSMNNINAGNKKSLQELLDYEYIATLVQATKNFIRYACNDRSLMVKLNGELKRYRNQNIDARQRELVTDVKKWMTDIYMVAGYTTSRSSRRQGLDGEILRYTEGDFFDITKTIMYRDSLDSYASNPSIENCEMVQEAVSKNRKRLDTQYYNTIYGKVRDYIDTKEFDRKITASLQEEVKDYSENDLLRNSVATKSKEQNLLKMLDDHFIANRNNK
ncbi:hypothetical protein [Portibacter lacus]|uniref:Lipoprotein n=1 Tax=Portibacter lacus TaxID=1099794 RepID=A0AA37WE54_9BACT|nr:hypothetical protein [Portibacter lacus]GLR15885.1 hypothetical protein GCM10007940_05000 [Portibacter lacus]